MHIKDMFKHLCIILWNLHYIILNLKYIHFNFSISNITIYILMI